MSEYDELYTIEKYIQELEKMVFNNCILHSSDPEYVMKNYAKEVELFKNNILDHPLDKFKDMLLIDINHNTELDNYYMELSWSKNNINDRMEIIALRSVIKQQISDLIKAYEECIETIKYEVATKLRKERICNINNPEAYCNIISVIKYMWKKIYLDYTLN